MIIGAVQRVYVMLVTHTSCDAQFGKWMLMIVNIILLGIKCTPFVPKFTPSFSLGRNHPFSSFYQGVILRDPCSPTPPPPTPTHPPPRSIPLVIVRSRWYVYIAAFSALPVSYPIYQKLPHASTCQTWYIHVAFNCMSKLFERYRCCELFFISHVVCGIWVFQQ